MADIDLSLLKRRIAELEQQKAIPSLKSGDGGGTYDGMDGWQSSVEARLGELKTEIHGLRTDARSDFRLLFGAIIAAALGLAGLMAKGFHWF